MKTNMSSPKRTVTDAIKDDFLALLTKRFLPPLVTYLRERKSDHEITVEELAKVLQLPEPVRESQNAHAHELREARSSQNSRGGRAEERSSSSRRHPPPTVPSSSVPGRGGRRRGDKKPIPLDEQCLYILTRKKDGGEPTRCPKEKMRDSDGNIIEGFCKTCLGKKACQAQKERILDNNHDPITLDVPLDAKESPSRTRSKSVPRSSSSHPRSSAPAASYPSSRRSAIVTAESDSNGDKVTSSGLVLRIVDGKTICVGSRAKGSSVTERILTKEQDEECHKNGHAKADDLVIEKPKGIFPRIKPITAENLKKIAKISEQSKEEDDNDGEDDHPMDE
jgi:hypothetical protein